MISIEASAKLLPKFVLVSTPNTPTLISRLSCTPTKVVNSSNDLNANSYLSCLLLHVAGSSINADTYLLPYFAREIFFSRMNEFYMIHCYLILTRNLLHILLRRINFEALKIRDNCQTHVSTTLFKFSDIPPNFHSVNIRM